MQAPAIDDHVTTQLYSWYTIVSEWEPPGEGFTGICATCAQSALACRIDVAVWPHDVIHKLVEALITVIDDVQTSYYEESEDGAAADPQYGRRAVSGILERYAADIEDVLEQCLSERLQTYLTGQIDSGDWDVTRRAAS